MQFTHATNHWHHSTVTKPRQRCWRWCVKASLPDKAGVNRMTITRIEGNVPRRYQPSTIRKLAKALKVKPQEIDLPPRD